MTELETNEAPVIHDVQWLTDQLPLMELPVVRRIENDYRSHLHVFRDGPIRAEIERALSVIEKYLDETLPKAPASFRDHDHSQGDRAKRNWPEHLHATTLDIHLHLCELLDTWRIAPMRDHRSEVHIDTVAELEGRTQFNFGSEHDREDFITAYFLQDFVIKQGAFLGDNYWLILANKFAPHDAQNFLAVYNGCMNRLAAAYEERRRAVAVDGGKVGFMSVDHFAYREQVELNAITNARCLLGIGHKVVASEGA